MTSQAPSVYTTIIVGIILAIIMVGGTVSIGNKIDDKEINVDIPSAEAIAGEVLANVDIPTASEIAAEIDMPDTILSVRDEKKAVAEDIATDELDDRDVRELIVHYIDSYCDDTDLERRDITSIDVKDVEVDTYGHNAVVTIELKVYFNNFGDEPESARVEMRFVVTDLDRDDDYEDAEVNSFEILGSAYSCSTE